MRTYGHNDQDLIHARGIHALGDEEIPPMTEDEEELAAGLALAKDEPEQETVIKKFLKGFKGNE